MGRNPWRLLLLWICVFTAVMSQDDVAFGQVLRVQPDRTTQTKLLGSSDCSNDCTVVGGVRSGSNLFHSFREFGIVDAATVTFLDQGATNVFARVSGGASLIEGTLAISGDSAARFFLVNPEGIEFGSNATFLSSGSLVVTTANSIVFADNSLFSAQESTIPPVATLSVSVPVGLQFGQTLSAIVNRSQASPDGRLNSFGNPVGISVNAGETIALLGNSVVLEGGNVTANSGQIAIAGIGGNSYVSFSDDLLFGYDATSNFQDIEFTQRSALDVSGVGGQLYLRGRDISVAENSALVNTRLGGGSLSGLVSLIAERDINFSSGVISSTAQRQATGEGTTLHLGAENLTLKSNSLISGGTLGSANGGSVDIDVLDTISIGSDAANLFLPAIVTTSTEGSGKGGDLNISARRLDVVNGAQLQSVTFGPGQGGNLRLEVDQITVAGSATTLLGSRFTSGISASSGFEGLPFQPTGEGGNVIINTDELRLDEGAQIAVNSLGAGDSGDLSVNAGSVWLDNGAQLSASAAFGNGGNIVVSDARTLVLRRGSLISTQAGTGDGMGDGGNISVGADFIVTVPGEDSDIVSKATQGRGGNITIDTQGLYGIAERRAVAGNQTNDIDASSDFGISGTIAVNQLLSEAAQPLLSDFDRTSAVDTAVSQGCQTIGNRLVVTGRGGIPALPTDVADISPTLVDLGESFSAMSITEQVSAHEVSSPENAQHPLNDALLSAPPMPVLTEARSWQRDEDNQVVLTARSHKEQLSPLQSNASCVG